MSRTGALILVLAIAIAGCNGTTDRIVIAAGTTIVDSGFMQGLVDRYRDAGGEGDFAVVGVASAEALALLDGGAAQLAVTHAPHLEEAYLADHQDARGGEAFSSSFLIVGPPDQTVVSAAAGAVGAFAAISETGATFVSRGDGSGTHGRELELWALAGVEPFGEPWYVETGQGMGFTLQVTDQRDGFTLAEHGALITAGSGLTLEPVPLDGEALLENPYRILWEDAAPDEARRFAEWLTSPEGAAVAVAVNEQLFGSVVYRPTP